MSQADEGHPAVAVLREFIRRMQGWEVAFDKAESELWDDEDADAAEAEAELSRRRQFATDRLRDVFAEFCEVGANARRSNEPLYCGGPQPGYNADHEPVRSVTINGDTVVVETEQLTNMRLRLRYTLVEVDGQWKIKDNRTGRGPYDKRWQPVGL